MKSTLMQLQKSPASMHRPEKNHDYRMFFYDVIKYTRGELSVCFYLALGHVCVEKVKAELVVMYASCLSNGAQLFIYFLVSFWAHFGSIPDCTFMLLCHKSNKA